MQAIILSIGDELVLGQTVDTNSAYLSARLASKGIATLYHQTLADDLPTIANAIRQASELAELVLITGGLGPTDDDLTRAALAQAMGVELIEHAESLAQIQAFFDRRGRPMAERNRIQALHPQGTAPIENHHGTAPGIKAKLGKATIYVTPGVPKELFPMFDRDIEPEINKRAGNRFVILTTRINTFGVGESNIAEMLGDLMDRTHNPKVGTTVSDGIVGVRIRSEFPTRQQAERELQGTMAQVADRLGGIIFGTDEATLQDDVVAMLQRDNLTLATAESCTGGWIGKMMTDVPGSSSVYLGGWITYADKMKINQLNVNEVTIREHGVVSEPVVRAMAQAAMKKADADLSLAISGIAGPGGGSPAKPVGTVWIAMGWRDDKKQVQTHALPFIFPGDREMVRDRAAKCALQMLRLHINGEPMERIQWSVSSQLVSVSGQQ